MIQVLLFLLLFFCEWSFAHSTKMLITLPPEPAQVNAEIKNLKITNSLWDDITEHFSLTAEAEHPAVKWQINWFLAHPKVLYKMLHNARFYLYAVYQETKKRNFPAEIALLPMVESAY